MRLASPLIPGFNPDPSITRVGDHYYLVTSTFEFLPGLPVYRSADLVEWTLIGHVVTRVGQLQMEDVFTGGGAWAPTIRHRDGVFHVVVTDAGGRGMLHFTATDAAGPWSDGSPVGLSGIDPDIAWDDDGTCIITYSGLVVDGEERGRHLGIMQARVDLATGVAMEEPQSIWSGVGLMFPEAPHLYRHDGQWYLLIAEGGTERGHAVSVARSDSPYGPWESCPDNPVLSARSTARPIQNTGHGDLIEAPDGSWHLVLLGMRVLGLTRSFSPLGRETFATPVTWRDGWPMPEPVELIGEARPVFDDTFASAELGPEWVAVRRTPASVATVVSGPGAGVRLIGEGRHLNHPSPTLIGRRQRRLDARITVVVEQCTAVGGLTIRYDENQHYDLEITPDAVIARAALATITDERRVPRPTGRLTLQLQMLVPKGDYAGAMSCDMIRLSVAGDTGADAGVDHEIAVFDGRYVSAETACSFTGRVIGLYCIDGEMLVSRYTEDGVA
jgi:xylan 1,4-beta-xylosidase